MKFKAIPVILTAALTSVMTLFAVSHFQHTTDYFTSTRQAVPVNYVSYGGPASAGGPVNFEAAAEGSVKAVVHIKTATKGRVVSGGEADDMFSRLFGQQQYYIPPQANAGSGVVISPDGFIVTNNHVVAEANEVTVTFSDGRTSTAKVVGTDPATDIAVLKVEGKQTLSYMEFGNSDDVKLGQWVLAVGYPLNLDATVTAGIVSAKSRSIGINSEQSKAAIESFIQTDAAVNPGNSGGALVNTAGQLVGINSAIASPTGSYAGYSYAIPSNIVRKAVNDLMKYGSVQRAYLGIRYVDTRNLSSEQLTSLGIDGVNDGVYVMEVVDNSGAAKAGIKKGDLITEINGVAVNTTPELMGQIARYQPGDNVSIMYSRGGKPYSATVLLTNLAGTTNILKPESTAKFLGASFRPLNENEKNKYSAGGVLVTDVGKGTLARQTQMHKGFVITGVNNAAVNSMNDLEQALGSSHNLQIAGFYPGSQGMYYYGLNNVDGLSAEE